MCVQNKCKCLLITSRKQVSHFFRFPSGCPVVFNYFFEAAWKLQTAVEKSHTETRNSFPRASWEVYIDFQENLERPFLAPVQFYTWTLKPEQVYFFINCYTYVYSKLLYLVCFTLPVMSFFLLQYCRPVNIQVEYLSSPINRIGSVKVADGIFIQLSFNAH